MHFAFIIDPLENLKPYKDTSIDLMVEATLRGHQVSLLDYTQVSVLGGEPSFHTVQVTVSPDAREQSDPLSCIRPNGPPRRASLREFDAVFLRKDPPFDTQYLALTYLLDHGEGSTTRFINSPRGVRDVNEKLFALRYAKYTPRTLVTWDVDEAVRFASEHEKVVLKTTFFGSGTGVFLSSRNEANLVDLMKSILTMEPPGPLLIQEYLAEGRAGDVRVMVVDGEPIAAVGRGLAPGDFRANVALGGKAYATELTSEQLEASKVIGRDLRERGIVFAGLDFIGSKLIEINVTSPTLVQELRRVSGFDVSKRILDHLGA